MEEKKVLLFSSRLPQRGKTKAFWEDVFINMADIFYSKTLTDVMQNIKLQIFSLLILWDTKLTNSTWIKRIREQSDVPILVVTDSMINQEVFIMAGADAVILEDSEKKEIMLQSYALIRRYTMHNKNCDKTRLKDTNSGLHLDQLYHRVTWGDKELKLSPREFDFLSLLTASPEQVYTFEQIFQHIWQDYPEGSIANMVWCLVRRLKQKLRTVDEKASDIIKSVRGVGYYYSEKNF